MTRRQIINNVAKDYNYNTRSITVDGAGCSYLNTDGLMCAVGQYFTQKGKLLYGNYQDFADELNRQIIKDNVGEQGLDSILVEEVQGHSIKFWTALQYLHDTRSYWNDQGLTKEGEAYKNELLKLYGEPEVPLTAKEIIEETANHYNSSNRAITLTGGCAYKNAEGNMCAVGRVLTDEASEMYATCGGFVNTLHRKEIEAGFPEGLDNILKAPYKGQPVDFWRDLQRLHDNPINWNEKGLSMTGEKLKEILLKKWE